MKEFEVTCVTKPDRYSAHEHITHIGNIAGQWRITRELAIRKIDSKEEAFYTIDRSTGKKVYVYVVRGDGGKAPTFAHMLMANGRTTCWLWPNVTECAS
jgi:Protein of unknown function (DUF3892)